MTVLCPYYDDYTGWCIQVPKGPCGVEIKMIPSPLSYFKAMGVKPPVGYQADAYDGDDDDMDYDDDDDLLDDMIDEDGVVHFDSFTPQLPPLMHQTEAPNNPLLQWVQDFKSLIHGLVLLDEPSKSLISNAIFSGSPPNSKFSEIGVAHQTSTNTASYSNQLD